MARTTTAATTSPRPRRLADVAVQVEGVKQLRKSLKAAGEDLSDLKDAHRQAATVVASAARARAPKVRPRLVTTVRPAGTKTAAIVRAGNAKAPYANAIHWGWPKRGITANPFISEAAQDTESTWVPIYSAAVENALDRVQGV